MSTHRNQPVVTHLALGAGALAVLATGADHLDEYVANGFSTVPTIGTLFLLNFIGATAIGVGLLVPWPRVGPRFAERARALLALSGIGLAASSLLGLWVSEMWTLFGFTDYGFRPTIVVAIVAESTAVLMLGAYLGLRPTRARC